MIRLTTMTAALALTFLCPGGHAQDRAASPADGGPRGDPYRWFTDLDYPAEARGTGAEGKVSVALDIDTGGNLVACHVIASSGNAALDDMTCRLIRRRGRFFVKKSADGVAEPYTFTLKDVPWHRPAP